MTWARTSHHKLAMSAHAARCAVLLVALRPGAFPSALSAQEAPRLQLAEVYAMARASNPMVQAAQARASAVGSMEGSARLPPDPAFQLGVMNASLPGLQVDMPGAMAPSLQVMQMLPFPGKLGLSGDIARFQTERTTLQAEETWWEVRARAAVAFYEIYEADQRIDVMRETLGLLEDFRRVAQAMYAAGEGRQSDVLRASVEVARMDAEISRMRAMRASAESRLNAVLGRDADLPVTGTTLPLLPMSVPPDDTLRSWAEVSRPLLAGGRIGVRQAHARGGLAALELWPDLILGLQYGQRPDDMGTERMGSVMFGFTVPVFAGRRQLRMRDEAAAMERMAEAELTDVRVQVNGRIGELVAELESARTLIRLYRSEVLPQAGANVSSAYSGYRVGAVDFMTLVDAQMTVNTYREELHSLLAQYGRLIAELEMTIGREIPASVQSLAEER